jgi:hypothetical protein
MHWHPAGRSHATFPHLHLYTVRPDGHFVTPRQTLESAVHWCIEMGRSRKTPGGAPCCRVRGHLPAVPIVVGGAATARQRIGEASPARARQDPGCQPRVHPASHNPPSSDCAAPGEGWAEGPSRRDAQRPSGGRRGRRDSRGDGAGAASRSGVRRGGGRFPQSAHSPQWVRKTAEIGHQCPTLANAGSAGQDGFSVTAHCAKPSLGRFCKAGVRGSIPLVSTG